MSISGFGTLDPSPYANWPAYAGVAEAMSGMYEYSRRPHEDPVINPLGGTGDSGTGLYAVIGLLAALRHRDVTGEGQFVDIAIYDSMLSLLDLAYNYWSMGVRWEPDEPLPHPGDRSARSAPVTARHAADARPHQLERLAALLGHPEWTGDERFADGRGPDTLEPIVRPAVEELGGEPVEPRRRSGARRGRHPGRPVLRRLPRCPDDEHVKLRRMVVEIPRTDGVDEPALVAGNPIKMTKMVEGPDRPLPLLGEHTDDVLRELLGFDGDAVDELRRVGAVGK